MYDTLSLFWLLLEFTGTLLVFVSHSLCRHSDQLRLYGSSTVLRDGAGGGVVVVVVVWRWSNVMERSDGEVRRPQST